MTFIGFCGDNCTLCPRYIATKSGDIPHLEKVRDLWVKVGWRDKDTGPEEITCGGCASVKSCVYDNVRICAKNKGIANCGECNDYPCQEIIKVFETTKSYERKSERLGYFCVDPDTSPGHLVFNRTVGLRDVWAKIEGKLKP